MARKLLTADDVAKAGSNGLTELVVAKNTIITPLAKDRAKEKMAIKILNMPF